MGKLPYWQSSCEVEMRAVDLAETENVWSYFSVMITGKVNIKLSLCFTNNRAIKAYEEWRNISTHS
jgi:hypothetical protein